MRAGLDGRSHDVEGSGEEEGDESPKTVAERSGPEGADDTPSLQKRYDIGGKGRLLRFRLLGEPKVTVFIQQNWLACVHNGLFRVMRALPYC